MLDSNPDPEKHPSHQGARGPDVFSGETLPSRPHIPAHWKVPDKARTSLLTGLHEGFISEIRFFDSLQNIGVVLAEGFTRGQFDKYDTSPELYVALKNGLIEPFTFTHRDEYVQSRLLHYAATDGSVVTLHCTCARLAIEEKGSLQYSLVITPAVLRIQDEVHEVLGTIPELSAREYRILSEKGPESTLYLDVCDLPSEEIALKSYEALHKALKDYDVIPYDVEFYSAETGRLERRAWGVTIYEKEF